MSYPDQQRREEKRMVKVEAAYAEWNAVPRKVRVALLNDAKRACDAAKAFREELS